MGCTSSKLDYEDTVRRCKERRRLIKDAVFSRRHLAAAHADYCRSLRLTASALSDFFNGEPLLLVSPPNPNPPIPPPQKSKVPHILSDSSVADSNYVSTPSQTSSVWNWDNFCPPPPPDSEFYATSTKPEPEPGFNHQARHHLGSEREEVHCSEWGDHSSTTSSDRGVDDEGADVDGDDERETRSDISQMRYLSHFEMANTRMRKVDERPEEETPSRGVEDMKMVVRRKDVKEIVCSIKDYFDMAAASGDQVSEMLETGRAQLDHSFRRLKKTVYHSSGVFSNLSSNWTSKPPLAVKYRLDATSLDEPGGTESLCSTLERLLAWEKKLYDEVKAREGVKIEHEKKLATLQNQEYKGEDALKVDKTKTSINKLQSLVIVTSQAVNTTSSAILGLRDSDLIPQLVELCHGMMYMWRSMNQFHEVQNQTVQQVRGLVNQMVKGESTSELHRQATRDLESAVSTWHSSFCRLIKFQRDFIQSLHGWFKLTLFSVNQEEIATKGHSHSEAFSFLEEWKLALGRLPDTIASEAIKSFINVVHAISVKQTEEFKVKKRTEAVSKELEKKASALRTIEKKYYHSYSMVGLGYPESGPNNGQVLDSRGPLSEKKAELAACQRKVEDEILKHTKAVEVTRAMTLNNLQTGLPGVFQSMTSFSSLFTGVLEAACTRSYAIK